MVYLFLRRGGHITETLVFLGITDIQSVTGPLTTSYSHGL